MSTFNPTNSMHSYARRATTAKGQGAAQGAGPSTISGLLSTLIPVGLLCLFFLTLFLLFRKRFRRIYEPRTYLGKFDEQERAPETSKSLFGWVSAFWKMPDVYVLNTQSLDAYLYLRFYKVIFVIMLVGACITWPILFPVYATGGSGQSFFNLLSMSNASGQPNRYYASVVCAYIFFTFVMFVIARETLYFIYVRQAFLLSPRNASRISSRTVLFTDVPKEFLTEEKLRAMYRDVAHIWFATNTKELEDLDKERQKTALKLEGAECSLLKAANSEKRKREKKNQTLEDPMSWADQHKRPTHRTKPLIGKKVDTLDYCRERISDLTTKIEALQQKHYDYKGVDSVGAVFIEFNTIQAAESAFQELPYHKPKHMQPRTIGTAPEEILWSNLSVPWWRRELFYAIATTLVIFLILLWTPLTVFAGAITNIYYLESISFLSWLSAVPSVITGLISGLLPSLIIAILMALVPIFLKMFAKLCGAVSTGEIQLMIQGWYFWFQFVIVFLITTFSSGAVAVGKQIANDPSQAPVLLAQNIPKASNFYISYFVLIGLATFGATLANIAALAIFLVLGSLLDKTPRKKYNRYMNVGGIGWGTAYPKYTTIAIIGIIYSMIAPLVLGFATVGLALLYIAFRYELIFVLDAAQFNTRGETYKKALNQLFVGIYVSELCMIGIFAMDIGSHSAAAGPMVLMIIYFIFTILFQAAMNKAFAPMLRGLPRDLLAASRYKQAVDIQMEEGAHDQYDPRNPHTANLGQDDRTLAGHDSENPMAVDGSAMLHQEQQKGWKGLLQRALHPSRMPAFAEWLKQPVNDYTEDQQRDAYLSPFVTSVTPLIWIPHDNFGGSEREKAATGKVTAIDDGGAYWDEKSGKLTVVWEAGADEWSSVQQTPLYRENEKGANY